MPTQKLGFMLSAESVLRQITHCGRSMLLILIEVKPYLIYSSEYNRLFFPDAIMNKGTQYCGIRM